jgi:hypothetical protein
MSGFLLDSYPSGSTIYANFHTFDSNGASITLSGLATTDIEIYKNGSVTQRASDAGYALLDTDGIDFDSVTGIHGISIDLSDNTDSGFYAVGSQYTVVLSSVTIDTRTVNLVLGSFRIMAAEHTAGYPVATIKDGTGTGEIDTTSGGVLVAAIAANAITATAINADAITAAKIADGAIDAATFAAGAITATVIATGAIDADALAADAVAEIADGVWDEDATGHQTGGTFGQAIGDPGADTTTMYAAVVTGAAGTHIAADIIAIKTETASILSDTNAILLDTAEIGAAGAGLTNINLPNQTMDIVGNITGNLSGSVGSVSGAVGSVTGNVGGNVTGSVGSLATQAKADVNAEVVYALATDTYAEPGQGTPGATIALSAKIGYLYKAWRNKTTQTSSEYALYADDATTKDQEAIVSDDGTTTTRGEVSTGA